MDRSYGAGRRGRALGWAGWGLPAAAALVLGIWGCREAAPPPTFTALDASAQQRLKERIDRVLAASLARNMSVSTHGAWQVLHGALVFGRDLKVIDGNNRVVPAIDYLFAGGPMNGWNLRPADRGVTAILESGSRTGQGHKDQWIGYLALSSCRFTPEHPIKVGTQDFVYNDLLTQAEWECYEGMEGSWTLMSMSAYRPLDHRWKSRDGKDWSVERLLDMEISQNIAQSACGGTHRLTGITTVVNRYLSELPEGKKAEGVWARAEGRIQEFVALAKAYQQPSGAFSTGYFLRPAFSQDLQTQIGTTGHTLEFLAYALTDEQIRQPWVAAAVDFLCDRFEKADKIDIEAGAFYHAAAGLRLYRIRVFGMPDATPESATPATDGTDVPPSPPPPGGP